jgi:8-oxo-dGTP diphosphatase
VQTVTAAIIMKDEKVFIAQRGSEDRLALKWEFPGGKLEDGETPEECLEREMKEEFGIEVSVGKFFAESIYTYDHDTIRLLAYITSWRSGELKPVEHRDCRWIAIEELASYELAPADIPVAEKLRRSDNEL